MATKKRPTWLRALGLAWRPLNRLILELQGVRGVLERIAAAQEEMATRAAQSAGEIWPRPAALPNYDPLAPPPVVDITYTSDQEQGELEQIGERLARATGRPPTEDEIVAEFERMHLQ